MSGEIVPIPEHALNCRVAVRAWQRGLLVNSLRAGNAALHALTNELRQLS